MDEEARLASNRDWERTQKADSVQDERLGWEREDRAVNKDLRDLSLYYSMLENANALNLSAKDINAIQKKIVALFPIDEGVTGLSENTRQVAHGADPGTSRTSQIIKQKYAISERAGHLANRLIAEARSKGLYIEKTGKISDPLMQEELKRLEKVAKDVSDRIAELSDDASWMNNLPPVDPGQFDKREMRSSR